MEELAGVETVELSGQFVVTTAFVADDEIAIVPGG